MSKLEQANVTILETKERAFANNDVASEEVRALLKKHQTFFVNIMSSPGSGKTTTLVRTIEALKDKYQIGVIEADVDSDVDAQTMANLGVRTIQLHTGGACHMDADMTKRGLEQMGVDGLDLVFLENIGNLVCPAEFDTGAELKVAILSVPEGDDKPLKYPLMFTVADCVLINKIDVAPIFDFDYKAFDGYVHQLNKDTEIIPVSSKTGEGFEAWITYLEAQIKSWREKL